jgi:hypothetical protein
MDDRTDGNDRPNKRNRLINSYDDDENFDDDDDGNGDDNSDSDDNDNNNYENDDDDDDGCLSTANCRTRQCSRCIEAILDKASIDLSHSE